MKQARLLLEKLYLLMSKCKSFAFTGLTQYLSLVDKSAYLQDLSLDPHIVNRRLYTLAHKSLSLSPSDSEIDFQSALRSLILHVTSFQREKQ